MKSYSRKVMYLFLGICVCPVVSSWSYNIVTDSVQYIISNSHLDTQWNWDFTRTRTSLLPNTFTTQLALMNANGNYKFSYESAFHYMIEKSDHLAVYNQVKAKVAAGQWAVAGSMLVAPDVTVSCPESIIRQVLYGNSFFKSEFGLRSQDLFLPDCFGWGKALPTIASHLGLIGMSTAKWYNFLPPQNVDLPADIFRWYGVDGSYIIAAMHPGYYDRRWEDNFDPNHIVTLSAQTGGRVKVAYTFMGPLGDTGGVRVDNDYTTLQTRINANAGNGIQFANTSSDQMFKDLTAANLTQYLPSYTGEMLMRYHGNALYTNYSDIKEKNRKNEVQAQAAEAAATIASGIGAAAYPAATLTNAWIQFLWHQMHDDLPGSSCQSAYDTYTIPDENAAYAAFSSTLQASSISVAGQLNTTVTTGVPVVVFNPLSFARTDAVETKVYLSGRGANQYIRVLNPSGVEVASQVNSWSGDTANCVFIASVVSMGYSVYNVMANGSYTGPASELSASATTMANSQFTAAVGTAGALDQYHDIVANKNILVDGARLHMFVTTNSTNMKAIDYATMSQTPAVVSNNVAITVLENGPARTSVRVVAANAGSTFTRYYRMTPAACGNILEVVFGAAWNSTSSLLKATFPFNIINDSARYDCGIGTVTRGINTSRQYEVVAQNWASIADNSYTGAVLTYAKYGWDKPDNHTLRLSLIHTNPNISIDIGKPQNCRYALYGKSGAYASGPIAVAAAKFNHPLIAFQTSSHAGSLGKEYSFLSFSSSQVMVMALKTAENSGATIVRVRELNGAAAPNVQMTFAKPVAAAAEVNGQEDVIGTGGISFNGNTATFSLTGFQPKAFAITFGSTTRVNGQDIHGIYADPGKANAARFFDVYDISGRRIGRIPCNQLTKIKAGRGNLPLKPGVVIAATKDGKERKIVRIAY
jgi:alpha-mannosidase